jgi:hypothetical protein
MEEESRPAGWITAALPIDAVLAANVEHPAVVRLDRRKLTRHTCDGLSIAAFDYPRLPEGPPLRRHVLYRLGSGSYFSTC